jgi:hypothetical protein
MYGSKQAIGPVSPAWLQPAAFALVTIAHLALLVGIPWPAATGIAVPIPLEVQIVPQGELAPVLAPVDRQQAAEIKPDDAKPADVHAVEPAPVSNRPDIAESKPPEQQPSNPARGSVAINPTGQVPPVRPQQLAAGLEPPAVPEASLSAAVMPPVGAAPAANLPSPAPTVQSPAGESREHTLAPAAASIVPPAGAAAPVAAATAQSAPLVDRGEIAENKPTEEQSSKSAEGPDASRPLERPVAINSAGQGLPIRPQQLAAGLDASASLESSGPARVVPPVGAAAAAAMLRPSLAAQVPASEPQTQTPASAPAAAAVTPSAGVALVTPAVASPPPSVDRQVIAENRPVEQRPSISPEGPGATDPAGRAPPLRPQQVMAGLQSPAAPQAGGPAGGIMPPVGAAPAAAASSPAPAFASLPSVDRRDIVEGKPAEQQSSKPAEGPVAIGPASPAPLVSPLKPLDPIGGEAGMLVAADRHDQKDVAALPPDSVIASLPTREEAPSNSSRTDKIMRYVELYDGGDCFFVELKEVGETAARLEGFGSLAQPFEVLDEAFRRDYGFEPSIDVGLVTEAQCPAITFLGRLRGQRADTRAPRLDIYGFDFRPDDMLTGAVDARGSRNIALLLISDDGTAQNVSHLLAPGTGAKSFRIRMQRTQGALGRQPQLLIAIASSRPLDALPPGRPVAAGEVFATLLGEAARSGQTLRATARYFKLENSARVSR